MAEPGFVFLAFGVLGALAVSAILFIVWRYLAGNRAAAAAPNMEVINALPAAITYFDGENRLSLVNDRLLQVLPLARGLDRPGIGRLAFFRGLAEADAFIDATDRVPAFLADVARWGEAERADWEVSLYDGRSLQITEQTTQCGGRLLSFADVTEQKQQSWALDEQSHLLHTSLESIDQGVLVVSRDRKVLTWNERYFELFGISSEIARVGLTLGEMCQYLAQNGIFDDNSPESVVRREEAIMQCDPAQHELVGCTGYALDVRRNPMPDGGVIITLTDVTTAKRDRMDLQPRSEELEVMFANLDIGIAFIAHDGEVVAINERLLELQGLDPDEVADCRYLRDLLRLNARNGELGEGQVEDLVDRHLEMAFGEVPNSYERIRPNGEVLEFRTFSMPGGGILVACQDITAIRSSEHALRMAKEEAELANRAKTEFLANTSHELRTPLNAIIGFSEILVGELFGPIGSPRYLEYAGDINESGQHLLSIINDLLDLAKVEAGHFELAEEQIQLSDLVAATARLTQERARQGQVNVVMEMDPQVDLIRADRRALKQVIINLLSNAIKFTPENGQVTIGTGRSRDAGGGEEQIELWVADTGIGMKPEDIPVALTPFAQLDGSFTRRYEGTGLGLPLARHFCELHGGTLALESAPGQGTTVTVLLPVDRLIGSSGDARQDAAAATGPTGPQGELFNAAKAESA